MFEPSLLQWHEIVKTLEICLQPERFEREIQLLVGQGYQEDEAIRVFTGLAGHYLVEAAGLSAALSSPPQDVLENLRLLAASLGSLKVESEAQVGLWDRGSAYARFIADVLPLLADIGMAMGAVLAAYVTNDYDLSRNPNGLMVEASRVAAQNPARAEALVARAGAMGMRGKRFWWGWPREISPSIRHWTTVVFGFVESVTREGEYVFWEASAERTRWAREARFHAPLIAALARGDLSLAELQLNHRAVFIPPELEEAIYALFKGQEALTSKLVAVFAEHREAAIPYLVNLAVDERVWPTRSVGKGWAPIHAVEILAKLGAAEAVRPLLQALSLLKPEECLHDRILVALQEIGQPALPHLLEVMAYSRDLRLKLLLAPVLGAVGRGSERARRALEALYAELDEDQDPGLVALGLVALQDQRTIPLLKAMLEDPRLLPNDRIEVIDALETMGVEVEDLDLGGQASDEDSGFGDVGQAGG